MTGSVGGPAGLPGPRWTHIALPASDLDASIAWYARYTPLALLDRREDPDGQSAWLCHPGQVVHPFVLVLVMFHRDRGAPRATLAPFAHIGIEVPDRATVIDIAERARTEGCLHWPPTDMGPPVGFICAIKDPDGNVVEISHDQGVEAKVREIWGGGPTPS